MRTITLLAFVMSCCALASCGDKPATSCLGKSSEIPAESMNDLDKYFMLTDFSKYVGSPISKLEKDFVIKYRERTATTNPPDNLKWINYNFRGNYSVKVYLADLKYTRFNKRTGHWNFSQLGREIISGVNVTHSGGGNYYYCKDYGDIQP